MKKLLLVFIATFALVACNDDTAPSEVNASSTIETDTASQQAVTEVTLDEAIRISNHIHSSFKDIWIHAEDLYLSKDDFSPLTHADRLIKRYKAFATTNFLTKDFKQYVEQSCYLCSMLPASQDLQSAENMELIDVSKNRFSLKAYLPLDAYTPEANVVQHFVFKKGSWKIDGEEIEVLQEADGMTNHEMTPPTPSVQFEEIYTRGNDAISAFRALINTPQDGSMTDISNRKREAKEQLQTIVEEFEQMIIPFDPYYETNKQLWTKIYDEAVQNIKDFTKDSANQETFIIETEAKWLEHRIQTLYELYKYYL